MMIAFRTIVPRETGRHWDAEAGEGFNVLRVRSAPRVSRPPAPELAKPPATEVQWIEDQYEEAERWDGMS